MFVPNKTRGMRDGDYEEREGLSNKISAWLTSQMKFFTTVRARVFVFKRTLKLG